ncbi:MAG: serine/threonine-protein kinase [bacterium]
MSDNQTKGSGGGGIFAEIDAESPPVMNPSVGDTLGEIRLVEKLGEGAMATVFRATHLPSGDPIAVKVLKAELCHNLDAMRRFDKEALVAQKVRHPNLIEITDVLHPEGYPPVLVMELLEGGDLSDAVSKAGAMSAEQAIGIATQICSALQALHRQSIVHRDVKPENVFLVGGADGFPIVKLLDFGLVKDLYGGDPFLLTRPDATIGTPAFMAPEQFDSPAVDSLADIYAVGAILYELLTGRPPFLADTMAEGYRAVLNDEVVPISERLDDPAAAGVTPALDAIVLRCLAKKPEHRIQDAGELRALLEACLDGDAAVALPPLTTSAHGPGLKIALGVAIGLAALGGLAYLVWTS